MQSRILACLLAGAVFLLARPSTAQDNAKSPALAKMASGELCLNGSVNAVLASGTWVMDAVSFTSPRGVVKDFGGVKKKVVKLHPVGKVFGRNGAAIRADEIGLGAKISAIGLNQQDGTLLARFVVFTQRPDSSTNTGTVNIKRGVSELIKKGDRARDAGQTSTALDIYGQAVEAAEALADRVGEGIAWERQGSLLYDENQLDKSQAAFIESLRAARAGNDGDGQATAQNGLGLVYQALKRYPEAIKALQDAVRLGANYSVAAQVVYLGNLGSVYVDTKDSAKVISTFERVIPLAEGNGMSDELLDAELTIGEYLSNAEADRIDILLKRIREQIPKIQSAKARGRLWGRVAGIDTKLQRKTLFVEDTNKAIAEFEAAGEKTLADKARERLQVALEDKDAGTVAITPAKTEK